MVFENEEADLSAKPPSTDTTALYTGFLLSRSKKDISVCFFLTEIAVLLIDQIMNRYLMRASEFRLVCFQQFLSCTSHERLEKHFEALDAVLKESPVLLAEFIY